MKISEKDLVLGLLHDKRFARKFQDSGIKADDFDKPVLAKIVELSMGYFDNDSYDKPLDKSVLLDLLRRDKTLSKEEKRKYRGSVNSLYKKKPHNPEYALDSVFEKKKRSRFIALLEQSAESINKDKTIDDAISEMAKMALDLKNTQRSYEVIDWMDDFEKRQKERKFFRDNPESNKRLKIGIREVDAMFPGIGKGEMASIAAKTNVGKSIFLTHLGVFALFQNMNVTHIITENSIDQIATRYDSRATGVPYDDFKAFNFYDEKAPLLHQARANFEMLRDEFDKRLKIAKCEVNATSALDVYNIVEDLEREGHKTDVLLIDSPELMRSVGKYEQTRLEKAAVYYELLALVDKKNLISAVSTQLTRSASDSVSGPEDLAEAYEKARILSYIFIISQTIKQKMMSEMMWRMVKSRDSSNMGESIILHPDFATMCVDTGI